MFKARTALLGALALFIVSGFATSVASAANPAWKVNGTKLGAQVKKQAKITAGKSELKGEVALTKVQIKCETASVENAYIEGAGERAGRDGATGITFATCIVVTPVQCKTPTVIKSTQVKSTLVRYGATQQSIGDLFEPSQVKGEFAPITLENNEPSTCGIRGTYPVKGSVVAEVKAISQTGGQEPLESKIGELAFPEAPITPVTLEGGQKKEVKLSIGENPAAKFSGKFEAQLVSGEPFGAFFG